MARNLKDIVDEGFSQLANLAEKRAKIMARAERIGSAASGDLGAAAELKLKAAEARFVPEMNSRVEQLVQELRHTLSQVEADNATFQSDIRYRLKLNVTDMIGQMDQTKAFLLTGTRERLDLLLHELETEFQSGRRNIIAEISRLFAELETWNAGNQSSLHQMQTDNALKITLAEYENSALLGKGFNQIVQGADTKRLEVGEFLDSFQNRQLEKLEAGIPDLSLRLEPLVKEQHDTMMDSCIAGERALTELKDTLLSTATDELKSVSQAPLEELEKQSSKATESLSKRIADLQESSDRLLKKDRQSLTEQNDGVLSNAEKIYTTLTRFELGTGGRGKVDEAFAEISLELSGLTEDLQAKLKALLAAQSEGLERMSSSAERAFSDLFTDFKMQLNELIRAQDQLCAQKEEELMLQLQKLEEQINQAYSLLRSSNFPGNEADGADGGRNA